MSILSHGHSPDPRSPEPAHGDVGEIAALRAALAQFALGRFLLGNQGLNGWWTAYVLLHPELGRLSGRSSDGSAFTKLESWLLDRCPIILATQERFRIFRRITQALLRDGMRLASLPCGLMDDLLTLDYAALRGISLCGIDLDPQSLAHARTRAASLPRHIAVDLVQSDAWQLPHQRAFDFVTSNGLNIYVADDDQCTNLYRSVARALRPGGQFLLSFITPPEGWRPYDATDLARQRTLFAEALAPRWQCFRTEATTREQLRAAGFAVEVVEYDGQRMFPAVLARLVDS
jgi:SAM-dependent methyltransferase